jgi:hypothetical protein
VLLDNANAERDARRLALRSPHPVFAVDVADAIFGNRS